MEAQDFFWQRLELLVHYTKLSVRDFELTTGVGITAIQKCLENKGELKPEKLKKIYLAFRWLNLEWLIAGEGEIVKAGWMPSTTKTGKVEAFKEPLTEKYPGQRSDEFIHLLNDYKKLLRQLYDTEAERERYRARLEELQATKAAGGQSQSQKQLNRTS